MDAPHRIDYVGGNYFEIKEGNVIAYKKPDYKRKKFDNFAYDPLYDRISKQLVEIVVEVE
ncbi:hypothetical protein [Flavobacterium soyangense]|uniref:Uncharacterized protein n=1 Tax=Flavobacterium soyangense TaxID=2023265 RepID=A0A930UAV7_9FLAO|nr:hypothetical protein [Flavobacterium soyangense]MBF2708069.1 hypothetical protein [Flavobacterium soyangense]